MFIKFIVTLIFTPILALLISFLIYRTQPTGTPCVAITTECIENFYTYKWKPKLIVQSYSIFFKKKYLQLHTFGNVYFSNNEWLFYVNKTDGNPLDDYLGVPIGNEAVKGWSEYIQEAFETEDSVRKKPQFYMIFAPNKSNFYSEKIHHYPFRHTKDAPYNKIFESIKDKSYLHKIVTPDEIKSGLKKDSSHPYYLRTDTHWNILGAAKTYNLLAKKNDLPLLDMKSFRESYTSSSQGDLVRMLSTDFKLLFHHDQQKNFILSECPEHQCKPINKTILIFGDSFRHHLAKALSSKFKTIHQASTVDVIKNKEKYALLKPDIVLQVYVERYLRRVPVKFNE